MSLTYDRKEELSRVLLDAYPDPVELERMVYYKLGIRLREHVVVNGSLSQIVFHLIDWADAHGRIDELVEGAQLQNARNPLLRKFYGEHFGRPPLGLSPNAAAERPAKTSDASAGHAASSGRGISLGKGWKLGAGLACVVLVGAVLWLLRDSSPTEDVVTTPKLVVQEKLSSEPAASPPAPATVPVKPPVSRTRSRVTVVKPPEPAPTAVAPELVAPGFDRALASLRSGSQPWSGEPTWYGEISKKRIKVFFTISRAEMAAEMVYRLSLLGGRVSYQVVSEEAARVHRRELLYSGPNLGAAMSIQAALQDLQVLEPTSTGDGDTLISVWIM